MSACTMPLCKPLLQPCVVLMELCASRTQGWHAAARVLIRAQSWLQISAAGQKLQQVPQPCQVCHQVAHPFAPLTLPCQVSSGLESIHVLACIKRLQPAHSSLLAGLKAWVQAAAASCDAYWDASQAMQLSRACET